MRPFVVVLAGVNGAGKSSVGGALLRAHGLEWFNPDTMARALMREAGMDRPEANARAWEHGRASLEAALGRGANFAFETTLGGATICSLLEQAGGTHDLLMLYCGLATPELHIERVAQRVAHGGHPIEAAKIRERWITSRLNLIRLLPRLTHLQMFDNSVSVAAGEEIPDPLLILEMRGGRLRVPDPLDAAALAAQPAWSRPIVEAAIQLAVRPG